LFIAPADATDAAEAAQSTRPHATGVTGAAPATLAAAATTPPRPLGAAPADEVPAAASSPRPARRQAVRDAPAAARTTAAAAPTAPEPARAAVLGDESSAPPVAAGLANELRVRAGQAAALVCVWGTGRVPASGAGSAGARALASRLAATGLPTSARGRLAWVALPAAPGPAADALVRVSATVEAPVVLALAGPRPAAFDELLDDLDLILVSPPAGMSAAALELALADLASTAPPVRVRRPLPRGTSRWLALAGRRRLPIDHDDARAVLAALR